MINYKQLCLKQRCQIQSLLDTGLSQTEIADYIGVHKSTISRELSRNIPTRGKTAGLYISDHVQRKTDYRHSKKAKQILLTEFMKMRIKDLMVYDKWSPELMPK